MTWVFFKNSLVIQNSLLILSCRNCFIVDIFAFINILKGFADGFDTILNASPFFIVLTEHHNQISKQPARCEIERSSDQYVYELENNKLLNVGNDLLRLMSTYSQN